MRKYRIVHFGCFFKTPERKHWQISIVPSVFISRDDIISGQPYLCLTVFWLFWGFGFSLAYEKQMKPIKECTANELADIFKKLGDEIKKV